MFGWFKKKKDHMCSCSKVLFLTKQDLLDWKMIKNYKDIRFDCFKGSIHIFEVYDVVMFVTDEFTYILKNRVGKTGLVLNDGDIRKIKDIDSKVKSMSVNLNLPDLNMEDIG
jgi:hypothetical protein